jgi:integrase
MPIIHWEKSQFRGVEYYKHATRKHGVKFDRYYRLRFAANGKTRTSGLGWSTDGWTEEKAALKLKEFQENLAKGEGPTTLKEEQALERERIIQARIEAEQATEAQRLVAERQARENITVSKFWDDHYFPQAKRDKVAETIRAEERNFRNWIQPVIGEIPIREVKTSDIERIKNSLMDAPPLEKNIEGGVGNGQQGRSPRLIEYCLAITRQILNFADRLGFYHDKNPVKNVRKPKVANERKRFLSHNEAAELLAYLKERSEQLHDISLLSLRCGLRAGEIFNLCWADVDFERDQILIRDPKSGRDRHTYMIHEVKDMLTRQPRTSANGSELIFKDRNGNKMKSISNAFDRSIDALGLNDGIVDSRHKLCFHSLRHSFASQLVETGTPLPVVKELLGHSTLRMTERYSHVGPGLARHAIQALGTAIRSDEEVKSDEYSV